MAGVYILCFLGGYVVGTIIYYAFLWDRLIGRRYRL
jgi:hypothetical protein